MSRITFSQLPELTTGSINLSSIIPVVQDGTNYKVALSDLPGGGGGGDPYDDSLLQASSSNWDNTYTTVQTESSNWDGGGGSSGPIVQHLGTIGGNITIDISQGESAIALLSADTTLTLSNAGSGESGLIALGHKFNDDTWSVSLEEGVGGYNIGRTHVMTGDLADFAAFDDTGYNIGTIAWFNDGQDNYAYVSNIIQAADPLNLNRT